MEQVFDSELEFPGFSYSAEERTAMKEYAASFGKRDYWIGTLVNALLFIVGAVAMIVPWVLLLKHFADTHGRPAGEFTIMVSLLTLALVAVALLFPLTMTLTALLVTSKRPLPDRLDWRALESLRRRILWQFLRVGGGGLLLGLAAGLLFGRNENFMDVMGPIFEGAGALISAIVLFMIVKGRRAV